MFEKLKGWIDLKAILFIFSIIIGGYGAYEKVGVHDVQLQHHESNIQDIRMNEVKVDGRILVLEKGQAKAEVQMEKLNDTLNTLNIAIVKLNSTLDNLNVKKGS